MKAKVIGTFLFSTVSAIGASITAVRPPLLAIHQGLDR